VLHRVSKRREVSSVVLLTGTARLHARHFLGPIRAGELLAALVYFRRVIGRPLLIAWDRLNVHRSRQVGTFLAARRGEFSIAWLPGYAPEINPEEQCNQFVKRDMQNALPASVEELRRLVRGRFDRLRHRPELLRTFFDHAGVAVNRLT
jgi:hypothetical protein